MLPAAGQDGAHAPFEQRIEASRRIAAAGELRQRQRPFGEAFEEQEIQRAAVGKIFSGIDAITGEARAATDPDG